jgi:CRISPR system Cascade subunit CasC
MTINRFLQLHLLTSYPPANLNRDDLGRPKTAVMGGALRLRVSSQSLKRAWRTSELFESSLSRHVGTRTKEMGRKIYQQLVDGGISEKQAKEWAQRIAGVFGKLKKANKDDPMADLEIEQLAHFSPEEQESIGVLAEKLTASKQPPGEDDLKLLRHRHSAADIALFGRMLASNPYFNTEAAAQVAHAISVHKVQIEDDFFTAVDDLNEGVEDVGAAHMGETEFGAGVFYLYVCVDRALLLENLNNDTDLYRITLAALTECAATIAPTGKQNSFASRARASYVLAEKGSQQPRSLSVAFLKPVMGDDILDSAISRLEGKRDKMDAVYGVCAESRYAMNAETGEGTLRGLIEFANTE